MAEDSKMTTAVVKTIAEKMSMVNSLLTEVLGILSANNYMPLMPMPMTIALPMTDLVALARVCRKKPEARPSWGTYTVSFSIYGCVFDCSIVTEKELKYWLEEGSVVMRGEKKGEKNGKA